MIKGCNFLGWATYNVIEIHTTIEKISLWKAGPP